MAVAAGVPGHDPETPAGPPRAGARVLVVEDEPAMLRALRINLRVRKYDVTTAVTGRAALAEAGRRPPDAVILDLGLPDVDGIEVIRGLRSWSGYRSSCGDAALPVRVTIGRCEIDLAAHTVLDGASTLRLTPAQWRLLEILLRHPGQLVGTRRLLTEIWGPGDERYTHYLRCHMAGLRRKLETDPPRPRHLLTEPGMGYRYQP